MTTTIDIPLDASTSFGLRGRARRVGLIALTALRPRQTSGADTATVGAEPEVADGTNAAEGRSDTDVIPTIDLPDGAGGAVSAPTPTPPAPAPARGGDVHIAHYYARMPGDANENPYTRLGGPGAYG